MNRVVSVLAIAIVLVFALALVVVAGLPGIRSQVTSSSTSGPPIISRDPPAAPPSDGSSGLVYGKYKASSGFSLLGLQIISPEHVASVGFVPPFGCEVPSTGDLKPEGGCAGVPVWGEVSGGGVTARGDRLVIVSVDVGEECFEALQLDERWPSSRAACASD